MTKTYQIIRTFGIIIKGEKNNMRVKKFNNRKILEYALQNCNVVLFIDRCQLLPNAFKKIFEMILEVEGVSEEDFLSELRLSNVDNLCERYFSNEKIKYCIDLYAPYSSNYCFSYDVHITHSIANTLYNAYYQYNKNKFLLENCDSLILKRDVYFDKPVSNYITEYYFHINNEIQGKILQKKIWDFVYPYSIEDICFLKNNQYWLKSIAHEKLCFIYCESEEEYNHLKSIGIEFCEEEYKPITEEERKEITVDGLKI